MELNWVTFVLEIVNFLILIWILKRFLYKPVLGAISQRKSAIDKTLFDAKARQAEAQGLERQYRDRLDDWEKEKASLRSEVVEEINKQRVRLMAALDSSLEQEREKARVLEQRRLEDLKRRAEEEGAANGVKFTARLLARIASPELQARLVDLVLEDLPRLPDEQLQAIRNVCRTGCLIKTTSAFSLPEALRSTIVEKLRDITQDSNAVEFYEDIRLLAGLRISVGPWVLRANLEDELEFFAGSVRHDLGKQ